jgi:hypothetical protein
MTQALYAHMNNKRKKNKEFMIKSKKQKESGVRCVGCLGGDAQPSLLLFSIFIL